MHNGVFNLLTCEIIKPKDITGIALANKVVVYIQYRHYDNCVGSTTNFRKLTKEELQNNGI